MKTSKACYLSLFLFSIILFTSCGVVERTMHPTLIFTSTINVERSIRIFGPENAKIYYAYNKQEPQLWGLINNGIAEIKLNKTSEHSEYLSSWNSHQELINEASRIFYTNQSKLAEDLILIVKQDERGIFNQVYENFWGFQSLWGSDAEEIKKWDVVQSVSSDYNYRGGSKYNQEEIWSIVYRDLVIEIK